MVVVFDFNLLAKLNEEMPGLDLKHLEQAVLGVKMSGPSSGVMSFNTNIGVNSGKLEPHSTLHELIVNNAFMWCHFDLHFLIENKTGSTIGEFVLADTKFVEMTNLADMINFDYADGGDIMPTLQAGFTSTGKVEFTRSQCKPQEQW
jgi:hypothetical protein